MQFRDIPGYRKLKSELIAMAKSGRIPHNILFEMEDGMPGIPLAIAWAQYINCLAPTEEDSCGECRYCKMIQQLAHPDVHFVLPVVRAAGEEAPSDNFLPLFRQMVEEEGPFFDYESWLLYLKADNSRPTIYSKEAYNLEDKLSLAISEEGYRFVVIYQPDRMNEEAANKLLKLMEEPPARTIFLSASFHPERLLETVISRMQRIEMEPLPDEEMLEVLTRMVPRVTEEERMLAIRRAGGIVKRGLATLQHAGASKQYFSWWQTYLKALLGRNVIEQKALSEAMAAEGRERVIAALDYFEESFRLLLVNELTKGSQAHRMTIQEQEAAAMLAQCVVPRSAELIYAQQEQAIRHIRGNVSPKVVLFDTFLALTAILTPYLKARAAGMQVSS